MPERRHPSARELDLPWWQRIPRRSWLVLIIVEATAIALLWTGASRGDPLALAAGVALGLFYAPLRAGGWQLVRPYLPHRKARDRDAAFMRRRR